MSSEPGSDPHVRAHARPAPDSLQSELDALFRRFIRESPQPLTEVVREAMREMADSDVAATCLREGMRPLDFTLPNQHGEPVSLSQRLQQGPVVLSFFRGSWCPYCSTELQALQKILPLIRRFGGQLLAISPQTPEQTTATARELGLDFDVLSDGGNEVASCFGLVLSLPEMLRPVYRNYGVELPTYNGDDSYQLPIAATYVLDGSGLIRLAFADTDYTRRLEPRDILDCLQHIH
ncbi:peroxiredoxin-like family protein [Thiohalobacter sp. IOR34]|uniref:peroxiredoxin-like family protein n=1 Tax=Thiohalobacter sp. IOR34 TaxID=3057176 RepID=UPI0025AF5D21|nr:peroxiredoxin-like family protein [Thiohalobacter sp. IOR34]WJW75919.1 peroxiredoxin-like family protein [Thiohalobacter sp. IOR34]